MTKLEKMLAQDGLFVGAHRGFSAVYPENTLLAVKEAVELGVDLIEVDVYMSKDGIPVIAHDQHLERCSSGTGLVHQHTLAELKQLDFGVHRGAAYEGLRLPTLRQFLEFMRDYPEVLIDIDCKYYDLSLETAHAAIEMIEEMGMMDRCVFNCVDCNVVCKVSDKIGRRFIGAPHDHRWCMGRSEEYMEKVWGICMPYRELDDAHAALYRERGIAIIVTPCDTEEKVRFAMQYQPTIALADDPRAYMKLAREQGIWTPWKK